MNYELFKRQLGIYLGIGTLWPCSIFSAETEQPYQLPLVEVWGEPQTENYTFSSPSASGKIDIATHDLPQSIQIRTHKLLQDIGGLQRTDELAKTVAGVNQTWQGNGGSNQAMFNIRGFPNNADSLKDGYRRYGGRQSTSDNAYVERIEFLKGPTSLLYGNTDSLGGQINFISKKPDVEPIRHLDFTVGSFDFYRSTLDVADTLSQDKSLHGRLNIAIEDAGSFRDYAKHNTQAFAPSFSYQISDQDKINLLIDYTQTDMRGDFGLPRTPAYRSLPYHLYVQNPQFDHTDVWSLNTTLEYQHTFNNQWKWMLGFSSGLSEWQQNYTRPTLTSNPFVIDRQANTEHSLWNNRDIETRLEGHLADPFQFDHHFVLGLSLIQNDRNSDNFRSAVKSSFNLLNPSNNQPIDFSDAPNGIYKAKIFNTSPYIQDYITVNNYLKFLLGVRYDDVHQASIKNQFFGVTASDSQTDAHISPRYAIIFQPTNETSFYFSYTTSFAQRINNLLDNQLRYKPEQGIQYEFGVKQWLTPNLEINLAAYELTRSNAVLSDVRNLDRSFQIGEQKSHGIELDINGQLAEQIRINANYALTDARVTYDNRLPIGTKRYGVPLHSGNIFATYQFKDELEGVEMGAGFNYASGTEVDMPNSFQLPANWQLDLIASYRLNSNYKIQFNLKNLTDNKNYIATADYGYITPLTPIAAYATLHIDF